LSRATPLYLIKLFEIEVPEIYEGIVTIKSAARDPGSRAKIAVTSKNKDVDPVGACVGVRGARVQNIVAELKGERIDIIPYQEEIAKFAVSALAPAEVSKVLIDEANKYMEVVVPDTQLSLAIGRRGQNVRLAAQLTGWKIDVMGETGMSQRYENAKFSLTQIPNITETLATALFQNGYKTIFEIAEANPNDITGIPGFDNIDDATVIVENAKKVVASGKVIVKSQDEKFTVVGKKTADELLKEEMQQLLEKEKEQLLTSGSEFLKVRGVGPSLIKVLEEAGIKDIETLTSMDEEKVLEAVAWEDKEELKAMYRSARIINNEKLIESGKMEDMTEEEKQKFQQISEVTKSVLLRLKAAGFSTVESVVSAKIDEFVAIMGIDEKKATAIYNAAKNVK
ncbi:MAG: helix-hairpin-helix domain-containing protein, partial [bacterium]